MASAHPFANGVIAQAEGGGQGGLATQYVNDFIDFLNHNANIRLRFICVNLSLIVVMRVAGYDSTYG